MHYHWAIIGLGEVANEFASALQQAQLPIYTVYSRSEQKAQQFCQKFNISSYYTDYDQLLNDPNVDIIYLATPHSLHYEMAKQAIEHKKHILCEKAITINQEQLNTLRQLSQENHVLLAEGTTIFYMPLYHQLKQLLPQFGTLKMIQAPFGSFKDESEAKRFFNSKTAGGALLDIGPYAFGLCQYFMPSEPHVIASDVVFHHDDVDESSVTILKSENVLANVTLTFRAKMPKKAIIAFEKGYLTIDDYPRATTATFTTPTNETYLIDAHDNIHAFVHEYLTVEQWLNEDQQESPYMDDISHILSLFDECRRQWKK